MIRTSRALEAIREEMPQAESISGFNGLKTTLEQWIEWSADQVCPFVDYVTIQSPNQGGTVGYSPAPYQGREFCIF